MAKKIQVYKIDSDIPVPEDAKRTPVRELVPIEQLEVGQSVEFPERLRTGVATIASRLKRDGKEFTIKKIDDDNARVWRVA